MGRTQPSGERGDGFQRRARGDRRVFTVFLLPRGNPGARRRSRARREGITQRHAEERRLLETFATFARPAGRRTARTCYPRRKRNLAAVGPVSFSSRVARRVRPLRGRTSRPLAVFEKPLLLGDLCVNTPCALRQLCERLSAPRPSRVTGACTSSSTRFACS
jgi:hypothetical protein